MKYIAFLTLGFALYFAIRLIRIKVCTHKRRESYNNHGVVFYSVEDIWSEDKKAS